MPRDERVFVVFVASPSDMQPERDALEEVIRELNLTWSRKLGIRLDLVRWETHGVPGFGADAQDVLNRRLPDDSDIFIGLMWGRYGTPTSSAGSGTEEEFKRALERYRQNSASIKIMIYFKDAPLLLARLILISLPSYNAFDHLLAMKAVSTGTSAKSINLKD